MAGAASAAFLSLPDAQPEPAAAKCKTKEIIQIFFIMAICVLRTL